MESMEVADGRILGGPYAPSKLPSTRLHFHWLETFMAVKALLGQVSDIEIRLLRIFKSIVECGGLSAAELELNIGRSTVSRHLKDLEDRLGLVLCRRGRAGFALTPEGQRVYEGAVQLLNYVDGFRSSVMDVHGELTGTLSVGLFEKMPTNPHAKVSDAIMRFRDLAPGAALNVSIETLNDIEAGVIDGRLHAGIVPDHRHSESLNYLDLFGETMRLYCGREHPFFSRPAKSISSKEVRESDYVGLAFHSPNMEATHRFNLRSKAMVVSQDAVALLILSGRYIGFLPDHYAASFVRDRSMKRIDIIPQSSYEVRYVAISRRSPTPSRLSTVFLDLLKQAHWHIGRSRYEA